MSFEDYKKISVVFPNKIFNQLEELSKKEMRTMSQQIVIIVSNYLKNYKNMLEIVNENDFGVITEEKLRSYLKKQAPNRHYDYKDIENYTFEELFKFWMDNFSIST